MDTIRKRSAGYIFNRYGTLIILAGIFLLSSIFCRGFLSFENLTNVLKQITVVTILAYGATFVIILGHINIAYGSLIALIGCIACMIMVATGSVLVSCLLAIVIGMFIGYMYGFVITHFGIPAFIMGLAATTIARGAVLLLTGGSPIINIGNFSVIGQGSIGFVPISVLIMLVLFGVSWFILNKTCMGRHVYATGGNEQAAVASGIRTKSVVRRAFIFDGFLTAVAGIIFMSRMASGQPAAGVSYEFDAVTAVIVGGASLSGGSGNVTGTIIGAIIVGIINNVQNLLNINSYWQQVVKGAIILFAVILDVKTKQSRNATR